MTVEADKVPADVFEKVVEEHCRWGAKSLRIVRAIFVDGEKPAKVAAENKVTVQHVGVLRTRFNDKLAIARLPVTAEQFMKSQPPDSEAALKPLAPELLKLRRNNYSNEQLIEFLKTNGIEVTTVQLDNFLKKATT